MPTDFLNSTNLLNQDFYSCSGLDFDSSRQYFWPGWEKLIKSEKLKIKNYLAPLEKRQLASGDNQKATEKLKVLDLGCGNCRFYQFLSQNADNFEYLGLDFSEVLLTQANKKFQSNTNFKCQLKDLFNSNWEIEFKTEKFDLVVMFGLMHHIPNQESRLKLFQKIKNILATNGSLSFATWQFLDIPRLKKKLLDLNSLETQEVLDKYKINPTDFKENDFLMNWKRGEEGFRFCHYYPEKEVKDILYETKFNLLDSFLADGREGNVNKYYLVSS